MYWVLLGFLALVLIFAASHFPKLAFSLLAVLVAVAAGLYYVSEPPTRGAPRPLDPSEVTVSGVVMTPYYAGSFKANGQITNNSTQYDLTDLVIRFSVEDCPSQAAEDDEHCKPVSQAEERVRIDVPPGATREFEQPVSPRHTAVEGKRRWKFKVVSVTGREPLRGLDD
jgi:hypothetical protein